MSETINQQIGIGTDVNELTASRRLCSPGVISQLTNAGSKESTHTRLIPLTDWPKYHAWPPVGGLRHMVFFGKKTGFDRVTVKVGRRRLIDEKKFFEFVAEQNAEQGTM